MAQKKTPTMSEKRFAQLISHHAVKVKWERANRCSCWNMNTGQPNDSCRACEGAGYVYLTPVYENDGMTVSGLVLSKEFNGMGDWKMGDMIANVAHLVQRALSVSEFHFEDNPLFPMGEFDKITLVDAMFRSHETLVRGAARPGTPAETLRYDSIAENDNGTPAVDFILKADPVSGVVTYYNQGTDFTITGNHIDWVVGHGPAAGEQYSVTYWHNPIYIIYADLPQSRDGVENQHMPRRLVLRYRDDF